MQHVDGVDRAGARGRRRTAPRTCPASSRRAAPVDRARRTDLREWRAARMRPPPRWRAARAAGSSVTIAIATRSDVRRVRVADAADGDQQTSQRRPGDRAERAERRVHRQRAGEQPGRGQPPGRMAWRAGNSNDEARPVTSTTHVQQAERDRVRGDRGEHRDRAEPGTSCEASSTTRRSYVSTTTPPITLLSSADMNPTKPTRPSESVRPRDRVHLPQDDRLQQAGRHARRRSADRVLAERGDVQHGPERSPCPLRVCVAVGRVGCDCASRSSTEAVTCNVSWAA